MGNTSSDTNDVSQSGRIVIKTNKTAYVPGDQVSGKIFIQTFSPLPPSELLLHLHGIEASYIFHDDDSGKPGIAEREIMNSTWTLYQWKTEISSEHIEIPFSFDLPKDLPPSFHQEEPEFIAHITYKLEAFVKSQDSKNDSKIISRIHKLVIRNPEQRTPKSYSEEKKIKLKTLSCIPQGSVTLKAHFEKDVYSQREEARVVAEVDNELGKLKNTEICFQLTQKIKLNHKWGGKTFYLSVAKSSIPGAAARSGPVIKSLTFTVPHFIQDYHNYDRKVILRDREILGKTVTSSGLGLTTKGKIISSEFYLEVYCTMKGANATVPRIRCPIDIRYPDPKSHLLNLPVDWNPDVLPQFEGKKIR